MPGSYFQLFIEINPLPGKAVSGDTTKLVLGVILFSTHERRFFTISSSFWEY